MGFKIIHLQEIERLPSISIFPSLFKAPQVFKRILTRLFFWIFQEENYYLELLVVADRIKTKDNEG